MNPCPNCSADREHLEAECLACDWSPEPARKSLQVPKAEVRKEQHTGSRKSVLWWAYMISPLIAPIAFAICFFVFGMVALAMNPEDSGTPVGVIIVPLLALTVGVLLSYFFGGLMMPVIFYLEKQDGLNFTTIAITSLFGLLALIGASLSLALLNQSSEGPGQAFAVAGGAFLMLSPFVLASATTFWWMQKEGYRGMSFGAILIAITVLAGFFALCSPLLRTLFF